MSPDTELCMGEIKATISFTRIFQSQSNKYMLISVAIIFKKHFKRSLILPWTNTIIKPKEWQRTKTKQLAIYLPNDLALYLDACM